MEYVLIFRALAVILALLAFAVPPGAARADTGLFATRAGVAVGGYDVVAFFQHGVAQPGHQRNAVMWKGANWHFASAASRARFESNPRAFAPAFGGYCAYAMSRGVLVPGDPQLWVIVDGRLFLLNNPEAQQKWRARKEELIARAKQNWPAILRH
jgi:uncharacterized RDD family membrane protein YckC